MSGTNSSATVELSDEDIPINQLPPAAEPAAADPPVEEVVEDKTPKPQGWEQRRVATLTRQRHEAERRAQLAEQDNARYRAHLEGLTRKEGEEAPKGPALTKELFDQRVSEVAAEAAFNTTCNNIYSDGTTKFPDFTSRLENLTKIGGMNPAIIEAAQELGDPAKIIYDLGGDLDEAARIMELPPLRLAAALAKFALKAAKETGVVSKASAPITPIKSAATNNNSDPEKMTPAEWRTWREKSLAEKKKR